MWAPGFFPSRRQLDGNRTIRGRIGQDAGYLSGAFGMLLATYTGVLVSNTAVPVWQASRRVLPILFGASAMASVGSVFEISGGDPSERRVTKAFGTVGQLAEIAAGFVMERQASMVPARRKAFAEWLERGHVEDRGVAYRNQCRCGVSAEWRSSQSPRRRRPWNAGIVAHAVCGRDTPALSHRGIHELRFSSNTPKCLESSGSPHSAERIASN